MAAQSVGGGGGIGGMTGTVAGSLFSLSVGVGGNGGAQGHGGDVHALNDGSIRTEAKHGIGILAQSVGGGGGIVRTMTTDHTYDPDLAPDNPQGRLGDLQGFSMSIGGKDNPSGDGGVVEVVNAGSIVTLGRTAHAVVAQSIGGGGGAAFGGQLVEGTSGTSQGGTGNGAAVSVSLHAGALVSTSGDGAYGILAQSIGGGGGLAGDFANAHNGAVGIVGGSIIAGSGNGGDVSVGMTGARITTTGRFAPGVFAQSIGGGGGLLSLNDALLFGTAGGSGSGGETVSVDLVGSSVSATGARSPGIMVQNDGSASGKSVISIDANSSVTGGLDDSGLGHPSMAGAIFIVGGTGNNISNAGTISGIDGTSNAIAINIFGALDSTTITNSGTIIGDILTPGVGGTVHNMQGGLIDARGVIDLGSAGQFINSGTLEVGGAQRTTTTLLTGNLVQGDSGRLVFAADLASGVSDQLVVVGHAEIGGTVVVRPTSISNRSITLLTATEGVVLTPVSSVSETSFALYSFPVTVSGNSLVVTPQASFAGAAGQLGANHQAVAGHLQALFDGGASADAAFSRLSTISDAAAYETALDQVSGKALGAFGSFRFNSSRTFAGNLFGGCVQPQLQDRSTGRCGWAHALVSSATQDASADNLGYTADSHALQMGGQVPLSDTVALTGSLAYEGTTFRDGDARISGDTLMGGLGLLYAPGRLELSAGIDLAYGWYKSRRTIAVGSTSEATTARPEQSQFGGHLRAAYDLLPGDDSFVRPFVEGHAVRVSNKAFTEAGSSPFRLSVESQSDTALIGVAGVEFGTVFGLSGSMKLRPFASAAVEFGNDRAWTTSARFADQPQSDSFRQTTAGPGTLGRFSIGADLLGAKNVAFSLRYAPEFGKDFHSHSGTGTLTILF